MRSTSVSLSPGNWTLVSVALYMACRLSPSLVLGSLSAIISSYPLCCRHPSTIELYEMEPQSRRRHLRVSDAWKTLAVACEKESGHGDLTRSYARTKYGKRYRKRRRRFNSIALQSLPLRLPVHPNISAETRRESYKTSTTPPVFFNTLLGVRRRGRSAVEFSASSLMDF